MLICKAMGSTMTFPHLHVIYLDKVLSHVVEISQRVNFLLHKREYHYLHLEHPRECRGNWAVHREWRQDPHSMVANLATEINELWLQVRDSASVYDMEGNLRRYLLSVSSTYMHTYKQVYRLVNVHAHMHKI